MMCYYQGCKRKGITKEHIPPRSFFPKGEKEQLLTVRSCEVHNNRKATDDQYVLAQVCMNASPSNRAREVFLKKIKPQLSHNNGAFQKLLSEGAIKLDDGSVKYPVDLKRFDDFFTALSYGIVFKTVGDQVPDNYVIHHQYPSLSSQYSEEEQGIKVFKEFQQLISGEPTEILNFGKPNTQNERIYTVKIHGVPNFKSSITIVHLFYGKFKVVSFLSNFRTDNKITSDTMVN